MVVPQGGVLGPILYLFNLYNLPETTETVAVDTRGETNEIEANNNLQQALNKGLVNYF